MSKLIRFYFTLVTWLHVFLIRIKIPICQGYQGPCFKLGKRRHQNTAYVDEERNYSFQCERCYKAEFDYWQERWDEYYGSRF